MTIFFDFGWKKTYLLAFVYPINDKIYFIDVEIYIVITINIPLEDYKTNSIKKCLFLQSN